MPNSLQKVPAGAASYERHAVVAGRVAAWGYHAPLESYWASVVGSTPAQDVAVGPEHLVPTITGLARAVGSRLGIAADDVLVALLCSAPPGRALSQAA